MKINRVRYDEPPFCHFREMELFPSDDGVNDGSWYQCSVCGHEKYLVSWLHELAHRNWIRDKGKDK